MFIFDLMLKCISQVGLVYDLSVYVCERINAHCFPNQYLFEGNNYSIDFLRPFTISSLPKPKTPEEEIKIKLQWNFENQNTEKATETFSLKDVNQVFGIDF